MRTRNGSISGAVGIGILVVGLVLGIPRPSPAPPITAVQVINTPNDPVPTAAQGTTQVSGNVTVSNSPTNPIAVRDVDNPARLAFQQRLNGAMADGVDVVNLFVVVPAGKRLVIEEVSAMISDLSEGRHTFNVLTTINNTQALHFINTTELGRFANGVVGAIVSQQVRLYADGGTSVRLQAFRDNATGTAGMDVSVSGYLVNLP